MTDLEKSATELNALVGSVNANPVSLAGQRYAPGTLRLESWKWVNTNTGPRMVGVCSLVVNPVYWPLTVEFELGVTP